MATIVGDVLTSAQRLKDEVAVTKMGWVIFGVALLAIAAFLVAIVLSLICWAMGWSEGMFPFVGTPDSYNRRTGAGRGLWYSIVRPWDTRPRHTMMDGQNS